MKALGTTLPLLLLAVASPARAADSEVGDVRRFGVGVALGFPPSLTLKAFVDQRNGLALHVGSTLGNPGLHLRLQFEQAAATLAVWDFGELAFTWNAGVAVNLLFGQQAAQTPVRFGLHAGVGVELRLTPVPVAVFGEVDPVIYPLDIAPSEPTPFAPAGVHIVVGARWFF